MTLLIFGYMVFMLVLVYIGCHRSYAMGRDHGIEWNQMKIRHANERIDMLQQRLSAVTMHAEMDWRVSTHKDDGSVN